MIKIIRLFFYFQKGKIFPLLIHNQKQFPIFAAKNAIYYPMDCLSFIKERREVLKITQAELAEYSGTSLRFIRSMEQGKANPSIKTLSNIADILGCEIIVKVKGVEE